MRVIAGKARRLLLKTTPGLDTRPTIDRIKETLFNIINPYIPGSKFLDLYSGSGSIGIEALSRGAKECVFVDNSLKAINCIKDNLSSTKLSDDAIVIHKNALSAINELSIKKQKFDIIYIDPPYEAGLEEETLKALANSNIIDDETLIIIEADKNTKLDFLDSLPFTIEREKDYKTNKHFFIRFGESN